VTYFDLDSLMSVLNEQILANLLRQLTVPTTARERVLLLESWLEDGSAELWYNDYFAVLPEQFRLRPDVAQLQTQIAQLRVNVQHFASYLAGQTIDPLLQQELQQCLQTTRS
jgi:hypothetical protein